MKFLPFWRKAAGRNSPRPSPKNPEEPANSKKLGKPAWYLWQQRKDTEQELELQHMAEERNHWQKFRRNQSKSLHQLNLNNSLLSFLVLIICLSILKLTASFSIPITLGIFLFMMLFPQVEFLHYKWKLPYGLSCTIILLIFVLAAALSLLVISMASFSSLIQSLPFYQKKLLDLLEMLRQAIRNLGFDTSQFLISDVLNKGLGSLSNLLTAMSGGLSSFFSAAFIAFLMLLFLLLEGPAFFGTIRRCFDSQKSTSIIQVYHDSVKQISSYLLLKTFISLLTGIVISSGLALLGVSFPLVWGILAFALNFIPSIGSIIHTLLVGLFSLLQFSDQLYFSLVVLLFLLTVQFLIGNYIEPRLLGDRLRLSPVFILLSLYIWGYIWGIAGMLLAVPILSVLKIISQNIPQLHILVYFLENNSLPYNTHTTVTQEIEEEE